MVARVTTYYIAVIFLILTFSGCEKVEVPEPSEEGTRYELSGLKNGEPFYIGLASPEFEAIPHCTLDEEDLWHLSSTIKSRTHDGNPSFLITLRNYNVSRQLNASSFDLTSGKHALYNPDGILDTIQPLFINFKGTDYLKLERISIADQTFNMSRDSITLKLNKKRNTPLSLIYHVPDAKDCIIETVVSDRANDGYLPLANWHIEDQSNNSVRLRSEIYHMYQDIAAHHWNTSEIEAHLHADSTGWFNVTYKDVNNNLYFHHKHLSKNEDGEYLTYGDNISATYRWLEESIIRDLQQPGSVELQYTDESGQVYTIAPDQLENHFIKMTNRPQRLHHETGIVAVEVDIQFTLDMVNASGNVASFKDIKGIIVIGVPF